MRIYFFPGSTIFPHPMLCIVANKDVINQSINHLSYREKLRLKIVCVLIDSCKNICSDLITLLL